MRTLVVDVDDPPELRDPGDDLAHAEFIKISKSVPKRRYYYSDHDDYLVASEGKGMREITKKYNLRKLALTFLIHARYEMGKVFQLKKTYVKDKKYKIGYLFNRIRRIRYQQIKLLWILRLRKMFYGIHPPGITNQPALSLLIYQKMAAYDVDLRDIARYLKELHGVKDFWATYTPGQYDVTTIKMPFGK